MAAQGMELVGEGTGYIANPQLFKVRSAGTPSSDCAEAETVEGISVQHGLQLPGRAKGATLSPSGLKPLRLSNSLQAGKKG